MDVIVKTGKNFTANFVLATKVVVDPDFVTVYVQDKGLKARMPYERGVLVVHVIPYTGGFLAIRADDVMTAETDWVTGVDSHSDGRLTIEYSRDSRLRIEAYSLITIEERPKNP